MEENKKRENPDNDLNKTNTNNTDTSKSSGFNWMDKLKPSNKNKLIMQKYRNLTNLDSISNINNNNLNIFTSPTEVISSFKENLNISNINSNKKQGLNCDLSMLSSYNHNVTSNKNLSLNNKIRSTSDSKNNLANQIINILNNPNINISNNNHFESEINMNLEIDKKRQEEQAQSKLKSASSAGVSSSISKDSILSEDDNNKSYLAKWNKCVFENKLTLAELNSIHDQSQVILKNNIDNTVLSDDLEHINNEMEERIKLNLCENGFLKQLYHSIIPFLLIQNKEIHRMCLSDYELKLFYKTYNKKKSESERKNPYESYRQGIIKFYKGKYLDAYSHFKSAHLKKESDLNIAKWLAFTSIILLMCNKKIDFTNIKNVNVDTNKEDEEVNDNIIIFPCCSSRKNENKIRSLQTNSIVMQNSFLFNNGKSDNNKNVSSLNNYFSNNNRSNSFNFSKVSQINLAKEITKLLKMLVTKENKNIMTSASEKNNNSNNLNIDDSLNHEEIKYVSHEIEAW